MLLCRVPVYMYKTDAYTYTASERVMAAFQPREVDCDVSSTGVGNTVNTVFERTEREGMFGWSMGTGELADRC